MARLLTCGFEAGAIQAETADLGGLKWFQGDVTQTAVPTGLAYSTAQARSGQGSLLVSGGSSGSGNNFALASAAYSWTSSTIFYSRFAFYATTLPAASTGFYPMMLMDAASTASGHGLQICIDATNGLQAQNFSNNVTQFTALPVASIPKNAWNVVEVSYVPNTGATVVRFNGVQVASGSVEAMVTKTLGVLLASAPTGACTVYMDDIGVNDNTGSAQTSWCGPGKIVFLKPIADNGGAGSYTTGAGGTTNLYAAVSQTPPAGVVQTAATATSEIESNNSSANAAYLTSLPTLTAAGIPLGASLMLAFALATHGNSTTTSRSQQITDPLGASASSSTGTTAAATYPTGWTTFTAGLNYAPSFSFTTTPTIKFTKHTASTDYSLVCQMAWVVEYQTPVYQQGGFPTSTYQSTAVTGTQTASIPVTPVSAGDLLIFGFFSSVSDTNFPTSVSGGGCLNWRLVQTAAYSSSTVGCMAAWMGVVTTPGASTVSFTVPSGLNQYDEWGVDSFTQLATPAPQGWLAAPSGTNQAQTGSMVGPSLTSPVTGPSAYWGYLFSSGSGVVGAASPTTFVLYETLANNAFERSFGLAASTAYQPTQGVGANDPWLAAGFIATPVQYRSATGRGMAQAVHRAAVR